MPMPIDRRHFLLGALVAAFSGYAAEAGAHSTKGRVKVPLDKARIGVDDVAFFAEAHVHKRMYNDGTRETADRYFIRDFKGIVQNGDTADVRFTVLDKKTNDPFDDRMAFTRRKDGVWQFMPEDGSEPLEVSTFVSKGQYYWDRYRMGITGPVLIAGWCVYTLVRFARNKGWLRRSDVLDSERAAEETA